MTDQHRKFYSSSNGDSWYLCRSRDGHPAVFHEANAPSGGKSSQTDLGTFLGKSNQGPEHEALRQLIGSLVDSGQLQAEYDDHD
jgi:hypothetical protein